MVDGGPVPFNHGSPRGRAALGEVVLFLIEDPDVGPRRDDWRGVLAGGHGARA
jgi:hypothetical protein